MKVESAMKKAIESDEAVNKKYELLTSVIGIGLIISSVLITSTDNVERFSDYRKYAFYCGTTPFEHSSGTLIHRKIKVSKLASTKIKVYITKYVISACRFDKQIKNYFLRKTKEGKHPASVYNAIKNKIIAFLFRLFLEFNNK